MAYDIHIGSINRGIRKEVVDAMVKQIAQQTYKSKQLIAIVPTDAWRNIFFREDPSGMANVSGNDTEGLTRGSNFPQGNIGWSEHFVEIQKFGMEKNIPWEDNLASEINVQARTIIRATENVVKQVDKYIIRKLSDDFFNKSMVGYNTEDLSIQSYAIVKSERGLWNESSAAIIDDIMAASEKISNYFYDVGDLQLHVSPKDKRYIMKWLYDKGAQWQSLAQDLAINGGIGRVAGVTLVENMAIPASYALLAKPKTCATYKELVAIRSTTIEDPYKSTTIRVVEEGALELTDPKTVVLIKNTQTGTA